MSGATLVASGLGAGHGDRMLFDELGLVVAPGDVVGLVGVNGAGKSTLLQILAGERNPASGSVTLSPPDAAVGYLPQDRSGEPGETLEQFVARRTRVAAAQASMDASADALARGDAGADDRYATSLERWLALGGADLDERTAALAREVGLATSLDTPMTTFSGGQAARAGLLSLLASRFDVVLLDEPTNDLDIAGLAQLERVVAGLREAGVGCVLVSHDREFLARTVTRVVELDLAQHAIRQVDGGYGAYLAEREVERRHEREAYEQYARRRDELGERARMQRAWMDKGVANARRKAKDNDKIGRKFRSETSEKQAAKARQTERLIERLDQTPEPRKEWQLRLAIAAAPRSATMVTRALNAVVRRPGFTLGPVNLQLDRADRVVITGANGAGKTTLLALLLGRLEPDEGVVRLGSGVAVGEIDQARAVLETSTPLARAVGEELVDLDDAEVRTLLAKFGLRSQHVSRPADSLSPGERTRAGLALLQGRGVNLLVLDEPTNHLDLAAIEQLEQALDSFAGTLLLVSHDRQLLAGVRATRRLLVRDGQVSEVPWL